MKKFLCCLLIFILNFAFVSSFATSAEIKDIVDHTVYDGPNIFYETTFYDTRGTKYEGVVERMAKLGIVNGMNETTFAPNKSVTRAELAKIITKMRGIDDYAQSVEYEMKFSDVKKSDWFYPYITIVSELELINGYEDGTFKPNKEVTYAELIVLLLRNLGYTNISEDNPNGWYYNYITKMRELELNDHVGEFDYTKPAKRGDVTMFVWNALITDRWAISMENTVEGFTYTYSDVTPLEIYFDKYSFLDNEKIYALFGSDDHIGLISAFHNFFSAFYTDEKVPLHILGGKVTALYDIKTHELIGVTFDEDYENLEVVSGPIFYLKEQGYNLSRALDEVAYGNKEDATYAFIVIDKDTGRMLRTVYLDGTNSEIVENISITKIKYDIIYNDKQLVETTITINGVPHDLLDIALYDDGYSGDWKKIKEGGIVTDLGLGLLTYSDVKISDIISDIDKKTRKITIDDDAYVVADDCICYLYQEEEPVLFNSLSLNKLKQQVGRKATLTLNVAEEVHIIDFGKTLKDEERYKIGFVTGVRYGKEENIQSIRVNYGDKESNYIDIIVNGEAFVDVGDMVSISYKDGKYNYQIISRDTNFDNQISVKYNYDAKKIFYPMIGEYIVTDDTKYYKVSLRYEDNSVTNIVECEASELKFDKDISDLYVYELYLIYNEDMEIQKVFAVNELNKFETQIGLVRDIKWVRVNENSRSLRMTLSIINDIIKVYNITGDNNYQGVRSGDIITVIKDDNKIIKQEKFDQQFIGYKRDLIVKEFNKVAKEVIFENGETMNLDEDVYDWYEKKINLNKYRFILTDVAKRDGGWKFISAEMYEKDELVPKAGDRFAIGELQDVIVVYRGYEE